MTLFLLIFFLLVIVYGFLIDYYRRAWNSIPEYSGSVAPTTKVSVVVAVRNEENNIGRLKASINAQDYPKELFELIVVDDHSTDNTKEIFRSGCTTELSTMYAALGVEAGSKKAAIATGVGLARGELIITTDADCLAGPRWISTIAACFADTNAQFIAVPVLMKPQRSILGMFQSLDFLALQGITGAVVSKRFHSMCNGANLAYTKRAFMEVRGFEGIDHLPSGDDMLLMHKIQLKYPQHIFYLKNRDAIVTTATEPGWKAFFHQRIRWASKAVHYQDKKIFLALLLTYLVNVCFVLLAIAACIHPQWAWFLLLFFVAKLIIEFPFVNAVAIFFDQCTLMKYFPFLQPLHIMYTVIAGWLGRFGSYKWKSRIVKNN